MSETNGKLEILSIVHELRGITDSCDMADEDRERARVLFNNLKAKVKELCEAKSRMAEIAVGRQKEG